MNLGSKAVRRIAARVRRRVLKQVPLVYEGEPYESCHGGVGLHRLSGLCAIASYELVVELHRAGYMNAALVKGYFYGKRNGNHCWVWLDDLIIDVTATQFDVPSPVLIARVDDPRYSPEHIGFRAYGVTSPSNWGYQSPERFRQAKDFLLAREVQQTKAAQQQRQQKRRAA
jgi:hypothetical protein